MSMIIKTCVISVKASHLHLDRYFWRARVFLPKRTWWMATVRRKCSILVLSPCATLADFVCFGSGMQKKKKKKKERAWSSHPGCRCSLFRKERKKKDAPNKFRLGVCWRVEHRDLDPPSAMCILPSLLCGFLVSISASLSLSYTAWAKRVETLVLRACCVREQYQKRQSTSRLFWWLFIRKEEGVLSLWQVGFFFLKLFTPPDFFLLLPFLESFFSPLHQ